MRLGGRVGLVLDGRECGGRWATGGSGMAPCTPYLSTLGARPCSNFGPTWLLCSAVARFGTGLAIPATCPRSPAARSSFYVRGEERQVQLRPTPDRRCTTEEAELAGRRGRRSLPTGLATISGRCLLLGRLCGMTAPNSSKKAPKSPQNVPGSAGSGANAGTAHRQLAAARDLRGWRGGARTRKTLLLL